MARCSKILNFSSLRSQGFLTFLTTAFLCTLGTRAQDDSPPKVGASERAIFLECLKEYKKFKKSEVVNAVNVDENQFQLMELIEDSTLNALTPNQLAARYSKFNKKFLGYRGINDKIFGTLVKTKLAYESMPLTDPKTKKKEEEYSFVRSDYGKSRQMLLNQSIECNADILNFVKQVPAAQRALLAKNNAPKTIARKLLPGKFQGARTDRDIAADNEKLNLTPVDKEFYKTQLGKKVQKDLGGMVDFWSYDYQRDELYVQVGDEVAKIGVVVDSGGSRIIKTKIGPKFDKPTVPDEKVNSLAEGRFLTGDKNQETLFGKMPDAKPKLMDESNPDPNH